MRHAIKAGIMRFPYGFPIALIKSLVQEQIHGQIDFYVYTAYNCFLRYSNRTKYYINADISVKKPNERSHSKHQGLLRRMTIYTCSYSSGHSFVDGALMLVVTFLFEIFTIMVNKGKSFLSEDEQVSEYTHHLLKKHFEDAQSRHQIRVAENMEEQRNFMLFLRK